MSAVYDYLWLSDTVKVKVPKPERPKFAVVPQPMEVVHRPVPFPGRHVTHEFMVEKTATPIDSQIEEWSKDYSEFTRDPAHPYEHPFKWAVESIPVARSGKVTVTFFELGCDRPVGSLRLRARRHGLMIIDPLTLVRIHDQAVSAGVDVDLFTEWQGKHGFGGLSIVKLTHTGSAKWHINLGRAGGKAVSNDVEKYKKGTWFAGIPY